MGSIPDLGSQDPTWLVAKNQNIKQKQGCNKFNEDFKNGSHKKKKQYLLNKKQIGDCHSPPPCGNLRPDLEGSTYVSSIRVPYRSHVLPN